MTILPLKSFHLASVLALILASSVPAHSEQIGTSCSDCPSYKGAFSIENRSGITLRYQVKWGESRPWKPISLASGHVMTHSYPIGESKQGKAPTPFVRFDRIGGDGGFTAQVYEMDFHAVGYAGYGPRPNTTQPKRYTFKFAADGRSLNLNAQ